ncbi:MAG TPA: nucleotidyltransferase domain-containing protein [Stellaceae bacterium]|nr:nucleotidyltransferase domain-containing protein [Stellaceae bacterium]
MARSAAQSTQRYPLTTILGAEANVRLLRELSRHGGQLSAPLLVARSGLGKTSVWAALATLEGIHIVASAGTGRARLYRIRTDHPLFAPLDALFDAEEARFTAIREAVRSAASGSGPGVLAVWVYGSVARGEDRPDSDLDVAVVAQPAELARIVDALRDALLVPGEKLGFVPSVIGLDPDDVERLSRERDPWWTGVAADAMVLLGSRPDEMARWARDGEAAA